MDNLRVILNPKKVGTEATELRNGLHARIVGQEAAVNQIVSLYQTFLAGLAMPDKPVGSMLFLGPTGTGKTRIVEATAEALVGFASAVIKVNCGEFQFGHEIAKLIGSPPGYLGHRETHPMFSQEILSQYHTDKCKLAFVLFDEIEKANDALWNLLLGILDKATLTLGDNRRVDFSQTMIFMTSNLGADKINGLLHPNLGFASFAGNKPCEESIKSKIKSTGIDAARKRFTPEFMNRITKTVVFNPLSDSDLEKILAIELGFINKRIEQATNIPGTKIIISEDSRRVLLNEGRDPRYGARHVQRAVETLLVQPISNLMATGQIVAGESIYVDVSEESDDLEFSKDQNAYMVADCDAPDSKKRRSNGRAA